MVLSAAAKAAWAGALASTREGRSIPAALQTAMVDFFTANDLALATFWPVDVSDADWKDQWTDFAKGAGLTEEWKVNMLLRWIRAKPTGSTPASQRTASVVQVLSDNGVSIGANVVALIDAAVASGSAGDKVAQATCFEFVSIL